MSGLEQAAERAGKILKKRDRLQEVQQVMDSLLELWKLYLLEQNPSEPYREPTFKDFMYWLER